MHFLVSLINIGQVLFPSFYNCITSIDLKQYLYDHVYNSEKFISRYLVKIHLNLLQKTCTPSRYRHGYLFLLHRFYRAYYTSHHFITFFSLQPSCFKELHICFSPSFFVFLIFSSFFVTTSLSISLIADSYFLFILTFTRQKNAILEFKAPTLKLAF